MEAALSEPMEQAKLLVAAGQIAQDRLAGIYGMQSSAAVPDTTDITSYVEVPGEWSRTGTTRISVPDSVPDMAAFHLLVDQDRVFEAISGGSAQVGWTITGTRADGRTFTFTRSDRFANQYDISFEPTWDLYDQLAQMHFNDVENITLDSIRTTSSMTRKYTAYSIAKVRVLMGKRWQDLRTDRPLFLRGGTTRKFRVLLTSKQLGPARVQLALPVPKQIGRKSGMLEILGGGSYYGGGGEVTGCGTVIVAVPLLPSTEAVIVALPAACAVTTPDEFTVLAGSATTFFQALCAGCDGGSRRRSLPEPADADRELLGALPGRPLGLGLRVPS